MKTKGMCAIGVVLCCMSMAAGVQRPYTLNNNDSTMNLRQAAALEDSFTYEGLGNVALLDDGLLLVKLSEFRIVRDSDSQEYFVDSETIALQFDTAGLVLLDRDGDLVLDRRRQALEGSDASRADVVVASFDQLDRAEKGCARHCLLSITGELGLDFSASDGVVELAVSDEDRTFNLQARIVSSIDPLPSTGTIDGLGDPEPLATGASCSSGECPGGASCNITCPSRKAAVCYCDGATPVCKCVSKKEAALMHDEEIG